MATYLGDGIVLTYLADESPILINSNDYGGPMNLVNGGLYETDNLDVLLSYLKPDSIVLDIGANLGFFTLQLAKRLRAGGYIHAFEPHPRLHDLATRTIYVNGVRNIVTLHNFGLSDRNRAAVFRYPRRHLGGGHIKPEDESDAIDDDTRFEHVASKVYRLDDVLPRTTKVDLVKIDVEGHELRVLRGMGRIIDRSPNIVILFEKLVVNAGYEAELANYLHTTGLELYGVQTSAQLKPLDDYAFSAWQGYVVAVRPLARGPLQRNGFTIYPTQLLVPAAAGEIGDSFARLSGRVGAVLFHGPYWFLPSGRWTITVNGRITGQIMLTIQARFGQELVRRVLIDANRPSDIFYVHRDLVHFECVASSTTSNTKIDLESVVLAKT
jgi:FkbM family methyltransferase